MKKSDEGILYIWDTYLKEGSYQEQEARIVVALNLLSIKNDCFYNCPNLKMFIAPKLTTIGLDNFDECPCFSAFNAPVMKIRGVELFGSLLIDLKNKKILNSGRLEPKLVHQIEKEFDENEPLKISKNQDGTLSLMTGENEILRSKEGKITHITLKKCQVFPSHALYENDEVEELVLLTAKKMDHNAVYKAKRLKKVIASCLEEIRFSNFSKCPLLESVSADNVISIEEGCFCEDEKLNQMALKSLESVAHGCFCSLPSATVLYLPNVFAIGTSSIQRNPNMHTVILTNLTHFERGILYQTGVENLYAPNLVSRSNSIKYVKNAKQLMRQKAVLPPVYKEFVKA